MSDVITEIMLGDRDRERESYEKRIADLQSKLDSAAQEHAKLMLTNGELALHFSKREADLEQRLADAEDAVNVWRREATEKGSRLQGVLNVCAESHKYDGVETFANEVKAQAEGELTPDSRLYGNDFKFEPVTVVEKLEIK